MDLSGFRNETIHAWVQFDRDTEVLVAYVSRDELRELRRQATALRFSRHRKSEETDMKEAERLLGRRAVKNWRALPGRPGFTMGGVSYLYSPENCDFLMERFNEFAAFVNEKALQFVTFVEEEKERELKNSSATSGQG